ncbi:MAG: right-handed parallel beta-helix repeat-containing protein [Methanotrichaceae archaeon]|nr:right-handed parallel beta-helix repeat-containing protein [Methanotrichaceae archaeon]
MQKLLDSPWLTASILAAAALLLAISGQAVTVTPGESIQDAVEMASFGETVFVSGGTYHENVFLRAGISLVGLDQGDGLPTIDASGDGSAITLSADGCTLEGLIVSGGGEEEGDAGIKILSRNNVIRGVSVLGNANCGILVEDSGNNTIVESIFRRNAIGIALRGAWGNAIASNLIEFNGRGIEILPREVDGSMTPAESGLGVSIKYMPTLEGEDVRELGREARGNVISNNRFANNGQNAYDEGLDDWDDGLSGNSFIDFDDLAEGCTDRNRDGICDAGLAIPGGSSKDRYPLASENAAFVYRSGGRGELMLERIAYNPGEEMEVRYGLPSGTSGRIELLPANGTSPIEAVGVEGSGSANLMVPAEEGSYDLRIFDEGGPLSSIAIAVEVPDVSASIQSASTCDMIVITYSGAPGLFGDWVGVFPSGGSDDRPIEKRVLAGSSRGQLNFIAPQSAGSYDFRLFREGEAAAIAVSGPVHVAASSGVRIVATPSTATSGEAISVSFWGAKPNGVIGMYTMTSPDKFMIDMQSLGGRSCGEITFVPPGPGRYDFRMFEDNVYRKHMGASNVVVVS